MARRLARDTTIRLNSIRYDNGRNHVHPVNATGELELFFHSSALGAFAAKDSLASEFWLTDAYKEDRCYSDPPRISPILLNRDGLECYEDKDIHKVYNTMDYAWLDIVCRDDPVFLDLEPEAVEELGIMTQAEWHAASYDNRPYYDFVASQRELVWEGDEPRLLSFRSHVQIGISHNDHYTPFVTILGEDHPARQSTPGI